MELDIAVPSSSLESRWETRQVHKTVKTEDRGEFGR